METEGALPAHFALGLASALLGHVLGPGVGDAWWAHAPHQLLLATPLSLLVGMLVGVRAPRDAWVAAGFAVAGLVMGNVILTVGTAG